MPTRQNRGGLPREAAEWYLNATAALLLVGLVATGLLLVEVGPARFLGSLVAATVGMICGFLVSVVLGSETLYRVLA